MTQQTEPREEELNRMRSEQLELERATFPELAYRMDACPVCNDGRLLDPGIQCKKCYRFGEK